MFVGPAHDDLDDMMQLPERPMLGNKDETPARRAQAAQRNAKLKDGDRRPRIGSHARIVGASLAARQRSGRLPPFLRGLRHTPDKHGHGASDSTGGFATASR